jgi:hypothetical protein
MSEAHRRVSKDIRRKMSVAHLGVPLSEESRKKMSESQKKRQINEKKKKKN